MAKMYVDIFIIHDTIHDKHHETQVCHKKYFCCILDLPVYVCVCVCVEQQY